MTDLGKLVTKGAVPATVSAVAALDPAGRRTAGAGLTALVRSSTWWTGGPAIALAVAAVGCLPSAAKAAAILGRRTVWLDAEAGRRAIETAEACGVGWLADLAHRLAGATNADRTWPFVSALLAHEKAAPPTTDAFVRGWVVALSRVPRSGPPWSLMDRLWTDPYLEPLLPRLFEVDGLGAQLDFVEVATGERSALPHALARLAAGGRLDRAVLLDRCLGRLLRGDRPPALRGFIALHDRLAPTPDEVATHANDYIRLLEDAPAAVATMAQKALRGASGIELDVLLDASRTVLDRPDKPLVRAQLTWLDRLARQHPDRAGEIAAVAAAAVEHPAAEVRDRAAALAAKLGLAPAPAPRAVVAAGDDLPAPPGPAPAPPPITDPDELAAEVAALGEVMNGGFPAAIPLERVLDGLVRLTATDQDRVRRALEPVLDRYDASLTDWDGGPNSLRGVLRVALRAGAWRHGGTGSGGRWRRLLGSFRALPPAFSGRLANPAMRAPQRLLWSRLAEIGAEVGEFVRGSERTGLVSAPTWANGALDAEVLYERIARLGPHSPWPFDLAQALLRLPPVVDEALATRAAALRSVGGDRLADWLRAGGLPAPVARAVTVTIPGTADTDLFPTPDRHVVLVETTPPDGYEDASNLLTVRADVAGSGGWAPLWPVVLPGYRELVAAFVLPDLAGAATTEARGGAAVLPAVAECTGTGGVATAVALAYGLAARHEPERVAALDALLHLAGAGELDAPAVGWHVGELTRQGGLTPSRILGPLRAAATAGARLTTWRILAAALPPLLALPKAPAGTPDLLTLAADTAASTGCRIEVPGLAEVAARAGSGRLVTEARRLAGTLA